MFEGTGGPRIDEDGDGEELFDRGATRAAVGVARKRSFKTACISGDDAEEAVAFDETPSGV